MKANIHPQYYPEARVVCVCGNTFTVGSTKPEIRVEICSNCHPFFTGEMRFVDTAGRVERFRAMQAAGATQPQVSKKQKRILKKLEEEREEKERPKNLKEMFERAQATDKN